ncbi:hypothetical protein [Pannonibacter sp. P2PFMT1]|uniref:hypothetical protein n=1 Tax=Pannonibacter sp. P2PFMT1 TaxID=2003582 RepID=UPI00164616DC|nr:hypothetical protein [Pannonibacter sp. P2PFMT1]
MTTPIPSNGYPIPPNNPTGQAFWQQALDNLHGRLIDIKAEIAVTIESLGDDAAALALELVANSVSPQLASLTAEMTALQQAIALAEDQLTAIESAGVLAQNVAVSAIAGLAASNAQAAIAELLSRIEAEVAARTAALAALKPVIFTPVAASAALAVGGAYRLRAASITLTLPAAPANGDSIRIVDGEVLSRDSIVTIARNGQSIMGIAENLTLDVAGIDMTLWYNGTTWRLF